MTRLAFISDIHGNLYALEAVLEDIRRRSIDEIFNLGDSLYGPLKPAETAERLMHLNVFSIMGNQDRVLLEETAAPSPTYNYVKDSLAPAHLDWLKTLPATSVVHEDIFLCHGTPDSDEIYLLEEIKEAGVFLDDEQDIVHKLRNIEQSIIFCGHSHIPRTVYLPNGKLVVNPGSVGLPAYEDDIPLVHKMESGCPHAKYTILAKQSGGWTVEHIAVPYDWEKASHEALLNGRPDWAAALNSGRV